MYARLAAMNLFQVNLDKS